MINTQTEIQTLTAATGRLKRHCERFASFGATVLCTEIVAWINELRRVEPEAAGAYSRLASNVSAGEIATLLPWRAGGLPLSDHAATMGAVIAAGQGVVDAYRDHLEPTIVGAGMIGALPVGGGFIAYTHVSLPQEMRDAVAALQAALP